MKQDGDLVGREAPRHVVGGRDLGESLCRRRGGPAFDVDETLAERLVAQCEQTELEAEHGVEPIGRTHVSPLLGVHARIRWQRIAGEWLVAGEQFLVVAGDDGEEHLFLRTEMVVNRAARKPANSAIPSRVAAANPCLAKTSAVASSSAARVRTRSRRRGVGRGRSDVIDS